MRWAGVTKNMNIQEETDAKLVTRARARDEAAFTVIVKRHKIWLYQFIRRHVPVEDAQDVLQESLIAAWKGLPGYDLSRPFSCWLRRIALNKCRDRARRLAVRNFLRPWALSTPEIEAVADPMLTPDERLVNEEFLGYLQSAINELPRRLKETLLLTEIEELSHREVSRILGITPKAVEGRVHRARKQLSNILCPATPKGLENTDLIAASLAPAF
jgi:RNA polymerase sigma-70 factor (ECF subfamily)